MGGEHHREIYLLPKIPLSVKEDDRTIPTPFIWNQFPNRPAFARTINKSQSWTMKYVRLSLQSKEMLQSTANST